MAKELTENNYMEALLRAAILLGDLSRAVPVREIVISGYMICDHARRLYPQCRIVARTEQTYNPSETPLPDSHSEDYLILCPIRKPASF